MSKFMILVKQLYTQKVKTKSFILMTVLYLAVISGVLFWQDIKQLFSDNEAEEIAVINETGIDIMSSFVSTSDIIVWGFCCVKGEYYL